ncbi:DUF192 domain-containing protein [Tropicibacter sp. R15_0]|jgi:uncharacterized membrane protein (UPF0127 family)|uniref:DUF192 domain-containing protein n=1 Tax=Tropicibacter sp. R15_0 TaxID=2821101 RepID=UPI001AD96CFE|nr:DUF192 domain-containing protein [Tropicibacter sp. R15_0]MBO9468431.1 DUF192 domain-containing protein [Tropicibacter sp. R15_0]
MAAKKTTLDFTQGKLRQTWLGYVLAGAVFLIALLSIFAALSASSAWPLCRYISVSMLSPELVLTAELAATSRAKLAGMQNRSTFSPADAMLFTYDDPKLVSFWMKDTPIPLDIVFLDAAGVVSQIEPSAPSESIEPIESERPIMAALEVPSGTASSRGIEIGSRMIFDPELCIDP